MQGLLKQDKKHPKINDYAELLYSQALLTEGSPIKDTAQFTRLVTELMVAEGQSLKK